MFIFSLIFSPWARRYVLPPNLMSRNTESFYSVSSTFKSTPVPRPLGIYSGFTWISVVFIDHVYPPLLSHRDVCVFSVASSHLSSCTSFSRHVVPSHCTVTCYALVTNLRILRVSITVFIWRALMPFENMYHLCNGAYISQLCADSGRARRRRGLRGDEHRCLADSCARTWHDARVVYSE